MNPIKPCAENILLKYGFTVLRTENKTLVYLSEDFLLYQKIIAQIRSLAFLRVIQVEGSDDDSSSSSSNGSYFEYVRERVKQVHELGRQVLILTTLDRRCCLLEDHTGCKDVKLVHELTKASLNLKDVDVFVDRAHCLSYSDLHRMLEILIPTVKRISFFGSTICNPEDYGHPFADLFNNAEVWSNEDNDVATDVATDNNDSTLNSPKWGQEFNSIEKFIEFAKTNNNSWRIICSKASTPWKLSASCELDSKRVTSSYFIKYEEAPTIITGLFIEDKPLNENQLAKILQCSSVKPKSVHLITDGEKSDCLSFASSEYRKTGFYEVLTME